MRRHHDIEMGFVPVVRRNFHNPVYAGLGKSYAFDWTNSDVDSTKKSTAVKYMSTATADPALGSTGWDYLRKNWYKVINFDGWGNDDANMQKSRVNDIIDKINADTQNPAFTDWDNTALSKFFGATITEAKSKAGWGVYAPDPDNTNFGNRLALFCYKNLKPELWPAINQYMSTQPTRMFKEHLDVLGISNPYAKDVKFWTENPKFDYKAAAGGTKAGGASQPQTPQDLTPPPFDFAKLNATNLIFRDAPNGKEIKKLNPPLYAKLIGVSGNLVKVQLKDTSTGWTTSGTAEKSYWLPVQEDEWYLGKPVPPPKQQPQVQVIQQQPPVVPQQIPQLTPEQQQAGYPTQIPTSTLPQIQQPQQQQQQQEQEYKPEPKKEEKKKSSNTGLYIGIGAAVILGGLAFVMLRKKED